METNNPEWLTPPKVAARLGAQGFRVSEVSVRNWIREVVPASERHRTPGGHWRISPESVVRFIHYFESSKARKLQKDNISIGEKQNIVK